MAATHSIVVYLRAGNVQRVAFCDCCPPLTLEIRAYEPEAAPLSAPRKPVEPTLPQQLSDGRWRDHEGTYGAALYEPEE